MPIISSKYRTPSWLKGSHMQTIMPALFKKVIDVTVHRERIATPDGDFLDIDWSRQGNKRLAILSHGLEGNSGQTYILEMTRALNQAGWDTLSWNFRGCSGEINNKVRFYHAGSSDDLELVIEHARVPSSYTQIALIGFSIGGSMTLKYLGENNHKLQPEISHAIAISVPVDLKSSVEMLSSTPFHKSVYHQHFVNCFKEKLSKKIVQYPDLLAHIDLEKIQTFEDFDNLVTSPLYGFVDAHDYYRKCSCKQFIPEIQLPTLIVNAQNDPLINPLFQPVKECRDHKCVYLEMPLDGGHGGFVHMALHNPRWTNLRAVEFLAD
jgi:predicted alpha/beta-fold hydrolase